MTTHVDPGGGGALPSYSDRVKLNMKKFKSLDRNVLEITLEKNYKEDIVNLSGEDVA